VLKVSALGLRRTAVSAQHVKHAITAEAAYRAQTVQEALLLLDIIHKFSPFFARMRVKRVRGFDMLGGNGASLTPIFAGILPDLVN